MKFAKIGAVLAFSLLLGSSFAAAQNCSILDTGPGTLQLTVTPDGGAITIATAIVNAATSNATPGPGPIACAPAGCVINLLQTAVGPTSWLGDFTQVDNSGGTPVPGPSFSCGPYTNTDGLPVELVSFSVE